MADHPAKGSSRMALTIIASPEGEHNQANQFPTVRVVSSIESLTTLFYPIPGKPEHECIIVEDGQSFTANLVIGQRHVGAKQVTEPRHIRMLHSFDGLVHSSSVFAPKGSSVEVKR
jgi:hypothetical protein